jgi:RNA-directed DNA polymerase
VNRKKSKVVRPWDLKYLGFSFYVKEEKYEIRVHGKSIKEFRKKLKGETKRSRGRSMAYRLSRIKQIIAGWTNYYGIANMKSIAESLDGWLRRRIRMCIWKEWKKIKTRYKNLVKLGLNIYKAWEYANTRKGYWRISNSPILSRTLTNKHLKKMGLTSILETYNLKHEFC